MVKYKILGSFTDLIKDIILRDTALNKKYTLNHPRTKYTLDDILIDILYVLKTGIPWRSMRSHIHWNTLYHHFKDIVNRNIFGKLFSVLKRRYLNKRLINTLIVDTSFIPNKYGRNKIARNKFYKNKRGNKISLITDVNGIPLSVVINKGTVHDIKFINTHLKDFSNVNKPTILLADKGYVSNNLRNILLNKNISIMTPRKSNQKKCETFDKNLYKKRIRIENTFQKLKIYRRINMRYDHYLKTFNSFVMLSLSFILFNQLIIFNKIPNIL